MTNPSMPAPGGDFDWTAPPGDYASPAVELPSDHTAKRGWLTGIRARMAALIAAGAIVGGGVALAVDHPSASGSTSASSSAPGAGTAPGGAGGIVPTAYRLSGTITAVSGRAVTIKTTSGSKTYTVTSATHLQRNGSTVALSSFQVGDSVVGSTTTSGGSTLNDLLAGMGGGRGAPAGGAPGSGTGTSSGSSSGSTT